jgi:hypothetical protein
MRPWYCFLCDGKGGCGEKTAKTQQRFIKQDCSKFLLNKWYGMALPYAVPIPVCNSVWRCFEESAIKIEGVKAHCAQWGNAARDEVSIHGSSVSVS